KDYCIITPYDAQRAKIVKELEAAGLPSDKVFNVDSFQGHEAEYVIVSATRTTRPGFLSVRSRTNVMLTRCKAGMIIVTNAYFASYCAERTLLGKLTAHWGDLQPHGSLWIDWRKIVEGSVDLPGAPAPRPRLPTSLSLQSHLSWNVSKAMAGVSTSQSAPQRHSNRVPPAGKTKLSGAPSNPPTQLLEQQMSRLHVGSWPNSRFHRADDPHFPEIPNSDPPAKSPALQGSWRRGSKSVK
ncbi:AAA domain-containing protein, partial [Irpex rosettiformis]